MFQSSGFPGACGLLLCLLQPVRLQAEIWNQFRGPNGSGVAEQARPPVRPGPENLAWRISVPPGLSSPVLAGDLLFLTGIEGGRLTTFAFQTRDGKPAWRQEAPGVPLEPVHAQGSPAASTPLADHDRLFVHFGSYGVICYDHAGKEQWTRSLPSPKSQYGTAASPISYKDTVIMVLDDDGNLPESRMSRSRVVALRKSTGETVWETARPLVRSGWSTPMIWNHGSGEDLVILGSGRLSGYDPDTGEEKWFATGFSRETIAVPVAGGGRLFASAAMLGGVADERPDREPFWTAMLAFDRNGDGQLDPGEATGYFTFPLRPELPVEHPGFGLPLPSDPDKRNERQAGVFAGMDTDRNGFVSREELLDSLSFQRGKPLLLAIRPGGRGDITSSHVDWELRRSIPEIPSPLFHRDRIYLVRTGGLLSCVDAAGGDILYTERLDAPGQYSASPVLAGEHLYFASSQGQLTVVQTGDTFTPVHRLDLGEPAMVTPAIDADTLYLRTGNHLQAYRETK